MFNDYCLVSAGVSLRLSWYWEKKLYLCSSLFLYFYSCLYFHSVLKPLFRLIYKGFIKVSQMNKILLDVNWIFTGRFYRIKYKKRKRNMYLKLYLQSVLIICFTNNSFNMYLFHFLSQGYIILLFFLFFI